MDEVIIRPPVEFWQRFHALRRDLFAAVERELAEDGHCKHYEGTFEVGYSFPNYFEREDATAGSWTIRLDCYVIGPNRHYEWAADTAEGVMDECEADVRDWLRGEHGDMPELKGRGLNTG